MRDDHDTMNKSSAEWSAPRINATRMRTNTLRRRQRREDQRSEAIEWEACLEARWFQSLQPTPGGSVPGFKSNKSFDSLPPFRVSGDAGQSFRQWHEEFISNLKASIVGMRQCSSMTTYPTYV